MMCSDQRRVSSASGRSRPCVSEMTPMRMGGSVLSSDSVIALYSFDELADADHCPAYRASSDLLHVVAGGHSQGIETPVEGLEHSLGFDARPDAAGGAMLDVDGCAHGDLVAFTARLQRAERCRLHKTDHVWRRIHRRQFRMVGRERVLEFDRLLGLSAYSNWDLFSHSFTPPKRNEPAILSNHWLELLPSDLRTKQPPSPYAAHQSRPALATTGAPCSRPRPEPRPRPQGGWQSAFPVGCATRSNGAHPPSYAARSSRRSCRRRRTSHAGHALFPAQSGAPATHTCRKRRAPLRASLRWRPDESTGLAV